VTAFHPREIALNWYGEGPEGEGLSHCEGCEHRDSDLCSSPVYGYWTGESPQAEVMLLGEAPGGNSGAGRKKVDSSDQYDDDYVEDNQKGRDWSEPWGSGKNEQRNLKHELKNSDIKIPVSFLEKVLNKYNAELYYTNIKKCNDVTEAKGEEYDEARKKCKNYLLDEIEYVDPDVIVVFSSSVDGQKQDGIKSNTNLHRIFSDFGIKNKNIPKNVTDVVFPNKDKPESLFPVYNTDYSFKLIPSTHFTRIAGTLSSHTDGGLPYAEIGNETDGNRESVYTELADSIGEVLK
jgi:hypothetical protein